MKNHILIKMNFPLILLQVTLIFVFIQFSLCDDNPNDQGNNNNGDQNGQDDKKEELKCSGVTDIECPIKLMRRAWRKVKSMMCPFCGDGPLMSTKPDPTGNWKEMWGGGDDKKDDEPTADPKGNFESSGADPSGHWKEMFGDNKDQNP